MTIKEAKEILKENWWKGLHPGIKDDHDIVVGELVNDNADDEYFPDSFVIKVAIVKKGEQPIDEDWDIGFVVKKTDGRCFPALKWH